ncbi:hypothetical protein [Kitasatospora sp. NPDC096204]|uniref:hypothetical protein n=1 Tax=Kitasatospora sp. NPDC096204 TaxID=3364094 RepID=UPI00381880C1
MGTVAAVGERARVAGFALAGVVVLTAEQPVEVRKAWEDLPRGTALVIVTPAAALALGPERLDAGRPLTVVLP